MRTIQPGAALAVTFVACLCLSYGTPAASTQKPAQPQQAPQPSLFPPPPADDPSDISIFDLANAAADSNLASPAGEIISLSTGSFADWLDAQFLCEIFGISPCPPIDDPPEPSKDTSTNKPNEKPEEPPQNKDVIPIHGDSSTPVDEVIGGAPEPAERPAGPFVPDMFVAPERLGSVRSPVAPLPGPIAVIGVGSDGLMELRVYSPNALPIETRRQLLRIRGTAAPLIPSAARRIRARLSALAEPGFGVTHVTRVTLRAFCLEARKRAPSNDALYVLAPRAYQERFTSLRPVRAVAEFAAEHGYLEPQGDTASYGRFITQYAIWTKSEHWDKARFTDEFIRRTREDMTVARKSWTPEVDRTLRALAPGRWRDVRLVIRAADALEAKPRIAGGAR